MKQWFERRETNTEQSGDDQEWLDYQCRIDRSRLINSAAFRRLQGKTQVMGVGENDFFRTRLTHSLEVAQIGASIVRHIRRWGNAHNKDFVEWLPPDPLIETICLAHDIGHPAFGHNGEQVLNYYMYQHGGFEGNGQTLRILGRLGEYSKDNGYDLTRRTLLGILKYPVIYTDVAPLYPEQQPLLPHNLDAWQPPKCLHDEERELLGWILEPFGKGDRQRFCSITEVEGRKRSQYKSFDTSIMELADDITYGVHDLEDALAMGLLMRHEVIDELKEVLQQAAVLKQRDKNYYIDKIHSGEERLLKQAITNLVFTFAYATRYQANEDFEHPLLRHQVVMQDEARELLDSLKKYIVDKVILHPRLQTLEYKGQRMLSELFTAFLENPQRLLPERQKAQLDKGISRQRVVCDYLASMTDTEASTMYQRLFLPGIGSVFEPV